MKTYSAETYINGTAEDVWTVLTDAASYHEWDPNMKSIEGVIALEQKLVLHTTASSRPFKVTVTELTPNSRMVWTGGVPMGLFKGVRTFQVMPEEKAVHFRLQEVYSGPFSPIFTRMMPDLHAAFDKFVRGLKTRVEEPESYVEPQTNQATTQASAPGSSVQD